MRKKIHRKPDLHDEITGRRYEPLDHGPAVAAVDKELPLKLRAAWLHRESTELATILSGGTVDLVAVKHRLSVLAAEAGELRETVKAEIQAQRCRRCTDG